MGRDILREAKSAYGLSGVSKWEVSERVQGLPEELK